MILKKFVYKIKYTKIVFHFYSYRQLIGLSAFNHFIYVQPLNQAYNNFHFMQSQLQRFALKSPFISQTKPSCTKEAESEDELSTSFNKLFTDTPKGQAYEKQQICQSTTFPHSMSHTFKTETNGKSSEQSKKSFQGINNLNQRVYQKKHQSKIQRLKKLLPSFMRSKLCPSYQKILEIGANIDKYLSKRKKINFMENFEIVSDHIQTCCHQKMTWQIIKQILYIQPQYYKIGKDTFQNYVLGLPSGKQNCHLRRQKLRESLFNYVQLKTSAIRQYQQDLPQALIYPSKVSKFYPYIKAEKKSQTKIEGNVSQFKKQCSGLKKQFVERLKESEKTKQKSYQIVESTIVLEDCRVSYQQFQKFIQHIAESYHEKTVSNMYKSSLIGILRNKNYDMLCIIALLKMVNQVGLFLNTYLKDECKILQIKLQQKEQILNKFRMLCAGASCFN